MATGGLQATQGPTADRAPGRPKHAALESPQAALIAVGALTALAFALRLPHVHESLVGDEMYAYAEVHGRTLGGVLDRVREGGENSPPLYFVLAWASTKLGDPTVLIRLPSLLLGTATVPLTYVLGTRTVGRAGGLIGAALLTLSPFAIFYSSEARPYATLTFLVALSTLLLLRALDDGRPSSWTLYAVVGCAVLYAHYFGVFPLIAQGAWALFTRRDRAREVLLASAAIVVGYIPWLLAFGSQKGNSISILSFYKPLNAHGIARELVSLFPGHPSFPSSEIPGSGALVVLALALGAAALGALVRLSGGGGLPRPSARLVLVALLALATPVGFYLYSVTGPKLFIARYLSAALPYVVLLVGALLAAAPRPLALAATGVVLVCIGIGAVTSLQARHRRPGYKAAAHFIDRRARAGDAVVQADLTLGASRSQVIRGGRQLSLDVNFERPHRVSSVFQAADLPHAFATVARHPRFLLVGPEPLPRPPASLGARLDETRLFAGSLPLAVQIYSPANPAAGFSTAGLQRLEVGDALRRRRAARVAACLRRAGLGAQPAETSPAGSAAIDVRLPAGRRSIVFVYSSQRTARAGLTGIARFLAARGGEAKRDRDTVVGYTQHPPAVAASRVEACAR